MIVFLKRIRVELDKESNADHMWEQVKRAMTYSAKEVCGSMRVGGGKEPK